MAVSKTPEVLAYVAGIIDGEGTITLQNLIPVVFVTNTDLRIIEWLKSEFPKGCAVYHKNAYNKNWRQGYRIWWVGKNCQEVLRQIYPYLYLKRKQARICLRLNIAEIGGKKRTPKEQRNRERARLMLKALNKRGSEFFKEKYDR